MDAVATLKIRCVHWSPEVEKILSAATGSATLDDLKIAAMNGAVVFGVYEGGELVGAYMLRTERTATHLEGVIVAAAGASDAFNLREAVLPYIENQFRKSGCAKARLHTARAGLVKKACEAGWQVAETVLLKDL